MGEGEEVVVRVASLFTLACEFEDRSRMTEECSRRGYSQNLLKWACYHAVGLHISLYSDHLGNVSWCTYRRE